MLDATPLVLDSSCFQPVYHNYTWGLAVNEYWVVCGQTKRVTRKYNGDFRLRDVGLQLNIFRLYVIHLFSSKPQRKLEVQRVLVIELLSTDSGFAS